MHLRSFILGVLTLPMVTALLAFAFAGDAVLPHTFTSNTPALAAEVNANFQALRDAINDNHARIQALENPPACFVSRDGQVAVVTGSPIRLSWSETSAPAQSFLGDPLDMHSQVSSPERITVPRDGYYLVAAHVVWLGRNNLGSRAMRVRRTSGASVDAFDMGVNAPNVNESIPTHQQGTCVVRATAGDRLEIEVEQNSGATEDVAPVLFAVTYLRRP